MTWEPGTVWDNVDAFAGAIGVVDVGVVWGLANVKWRSVEERDGFIQVVLRKVALPGGFAGGAVPSTGRRPVVPMPTMSGEKTVPMPQESMNDPQYTNVNPQTGRVEFVSPPSVSV